MVLNVISKKSPVHENKKYFDNTIRSLTNRQAIWLQNHLAENVNRAFSKISCVNVQEEMVLELSKFNNFKEIIESYMPIMKSSLIPDEMFQWLMDNTRAQLYTYNLLCNLDYGITYDYDKYGNDIMSRIFSMFDFATVNNGCKMQLDNLLELLHTLQKAWERIIKNENYSKWLDEKDVKKIKWADNYLISNNLYLENMISISDISETRAIILASLDYIDLLWESNEGKIGYPSDRKLLIIDKMKRAWNQQKYRDAGKTKKPYHLPLTKETKRRLEKMAEVKGLSETGMLDIMINSAYRLQCLDVDGNEIF